MNGVITPPEFDHCEYVEVDPTGRYGRYNEILGKGASKVVYRAFDEYEGIEVAWNQVKLYDFLQGPEELQRLQREIHLLKTLKHKNIMKFYTSWVDSANRNINFVTEMFTSGTLRQYRLKHKRVNVTAVKHWGRQILEGLLYLHSHNPPVIHRDLKCDNIFINGNQGEVKIGDLGLAAILHKAHAVRCVGTPEFMAPEVYEEEYNELVDIYSFGMCILEMVTFEYPYSECTHAAQIYKKVVSGKKPEALYRVKDPAMRQFVEKCLGTASSRLPARELLKDPFLQIDEDGYDLSLLDYYRYLNEVSPCLRKPLSVIHQSCSAVNGYSNEIGCNLDNNLDHHSSGTERSRSNSLTSQDGNVEDVDVAIEGRRQDNNSIFVRLKIPDKEGRIRNVYFPFDIHTDTALSVAAEMVADLDITDYDVTKIADMIDKELATLIAGWKKGLHIEESPLCEGTSDSGVPTDSLASPNSPATKIVQVLSRSNNECASTHGRFEEITYQVEGEEQTAAECSPVVSDETNGTHCTDVLAQGDRPDVTPEELGETHCNGGDEVLGISSKIEEERMTNMEKQNRSRTRKIPSLTASTARARLDDYENGIRQELRWLKAKYQMQLRELKNQQFGIIPRASRSSLNSNNSDHRIVESNSCILPALENIDCNTEHQLFNSEVEDECYSPKKIATRRRFYTGIAPTHSIQRATSLPVDAVDV